MARFSCLISIPAQQRHFFSMVVQLHYFSRWVLKRLPSSSRAQNNLPFVSLHKANGAITLTRVIIELLAWKTYRNDALSIAVAVLTLGPLLKR